jgi:hypothetical protein
MCGFWDMGFEGAGRFGKSVQELSYCSELSLGVLRSLSLGAHRGWAPIKCFDLGWAIEVVIERVARREALSPRRYIEGPGHRVLQFFAS